VSLPQQDGDLFVTDGGMETMLIFHEGRDLPSFASFVLLEDDAGRRAVRNYYEPYVAIAREQGVGAVLDTATWRANPIGERSSAIRPSASRT
jgi:homocysteine S-methyltransferase